MHDSDSAVPNTGEHASRDLRKIILTHDPVKGLHAQIERRPGEDEDLVGRQPGHDAKVYYNYVEQHLPFPELPDFGIFYLSVPAAASLISEDLIQSGRNRIAAAEGSLNETREKSHLELTALFGEYISRSLVDGTLPCKSGTRDLVDLLERGGERFIPEQTYIHYNDFVKWLIARGYVDRSGRSDAGPALLAYEQTELDLAEAVERDVAIHRALQDRKQALRSVWTEEFPPIPSGDNREEIKAALSEALELVKKLEADIRELQALRTQPEDRPLTPRSKHSHQIVIAALCRALKLEVGAREATSSVQLKIEVAGLKLDNGTIHGILKEVGEVLHDGGQNLVSDLVFGFPT